MRIFFVALFVILGANLGIQLMDSTLSDVINERNATIQRQLDQLWNVSWTTYCKRYSYQFSPYPSQVC